MRMLRHYHEIGLLEPVSVDDTTGYRFYDDDQLDSLREIVALRELGLGLDTIGEIVNNRRTPEQVRSMLTARRREIVDEIAVGRARLDAIDQHLDDLVRHESGRSLSGGSHEPGAMIEVETKAAPARLVAQLSAVAESWAPTDIGPVIQPLYPELTARMERAGVEIAGPSTAWYDDTDDGRIVVNATLGIAARPDADDHTLGFQIAELPALPLVAATIHRGTMDNCDLTYQALLGWVDANGYRPVGYSREIDVECGPDRQWITELQIAIEPQEPRP